MINKKPALLIQIDCDSEVAISNHYGLAMPSVEDRMEYYLALDMFLELLGRYNLKATLFVVGKDVCNEKKCNILRKAINNGFEISNHTYHHPRQVIKCTYEELRKEIEHTNEIVKDKLGISMLGFRSPNFEADERIIQILSDLNYKYDCSLLATPYFPLLQLLKKKSAGDTTYLGKWQYIFAPDNCYFPQKDAIYRAEKKDNLKTVVELPISTFPYLRFPCHSSYLLALPTNLRNRILHSLIRWYYNKERTLVYVFHLADLVDNQYLYGTEKKYYNNLRERMNYIEYFLKLAIYNFDNYTTLEYIQSIS